MKLAAVVVTFNRIAHLQTTVARLLAEPLDHLVVVDNGSSDGSREWLRAMNEPRLTLLMPDRNGGGAAGFEIGLRAAVAQFDPDWLVIMDDDARPQIAALAKFRASPPDADAVAAAVVYPSGGICEMNRPWVNPFWHFGAFIRTLTGGRGAFHLTDDAYAGSAPTRIDGASFVGLFLSRHAIALAGYPEGGLFIYGDDVLYTLDLAQKGGRILFDPGILFDHDCAQAEPGKVWRPLWKTYYLHRNRWFVYRKAAGPILFWPLIALMVPNWRRAGRGLPADEAAIYDGLLSLALADARTGRRHRPHSEILALANPPANVISASLPPAN
jgi:rhamnopyranosyl-N-acetylglucosaminyl-diphospho-decaprenol beta-1,3/1,4-galactofuranosyltransferase